MGFDLGALRLYPRVWGLQILKGNIRAIFGVLLGETS